MTVAAAAGASIYLGTRVDWAARLSPVAASTETIDRSAAALRPKDTDQRVYLGPEQQRQASAVGGFQQTPSSLLRVDRRMQYGDFLWSDEGVPPGPIAVRVDLRTQLLSIFRGGHEIGTAVVLYGADSKETPLGRFPILWKGKNHR